MDRVIILRYSEIHLKGKNRAFFENILKRNIIEKLKGINCRTEFYYGRYIVSDYGAEIEREIVSRLKTVFGLYSLSAGLRTGADTDGIAEAAASICKSKGSFRVTASARIKRCRTHPYSLPPR